MMVVTYPKVRRRRSRKRVKQSASRAAQKARHCRKRTVGELQHLIDDPRLVLGNPHVLQDLDHHLQQGEKKSLNKSALQLILNI